MVVNKDESAAGEVPPIIGEVQQAGVVKGRIGFLRKSKLYLIRFY